MPKIFPFIYLITPDPDKFSSLDFFLSELIKPLSNGVKLVQLKSDMIDHERYHVVAWGVKLLCLSYDALLILNGPTLPETLNFCDGLHLNKKNFLHHNTRPITKDKILSATCESLDEIKHAEKIGVDIVTLGTPEEKEDSSMTAWQTFSKLAFLTNIPVFASGNLTITDLSLAQKYGAYGLAGTSNFWSIDTQIETSGNDSFH